MVRNKGKKEDKKKEEESKTKEFKNKEDETESSEREINVQTSDKKDNKEKENISKEPSSTLTSSLVPEAGVSRSANSETDALKDTTPDNKDGRNPEDIGKSEIVSISDILRSLQVIVAGVQNINVSDYIELANLSDASIENPKLCSQMSSDELCLNSPSSGEWCVLQGRIRAPLASWNNYPDLLKTFRHIVEGGVKEHYRIFQCIPTFAHGGLQVVSTDVIGMDVDLRSSSYRAARRLFDEQPALFQEQDGEADYTTVPVFVNPILSDFMRRTQDMICGNAQDGANLRAWVENFIRHKDASLTFNARGIYGGNDTYWLSCSHPRHLPLWLSVIPNANRISIPYTLHFTGPSFATRPINVTISASNLKISNSFASAAPSLTSSPVTGSMGKSWKLYLHSGV